MDKQDIIEEYQCSGCAVGSDTECGKFKTDPSSGIGCDYHVPGTSVSSIGRIFLGMPKGFNRLGYQDDLRIQIYESQEQQENLHSYDEFNCAVWKYKNDKGHIFIRGYRPRINDPFVHVIISGDFDRIDAHEIDINEID